MSGQIWVRFGKRLGLVRLDNEYQTRETWLVRRSWPVRFGSIVVTKAKLRKCQVRTGSLRSRHGPDNSCKICAGQLK